jgi:hypothetical protein
MSRRIDAHEHRGDDHHHHIHEAKHGEPDAPLAINKLLIEPVFNHVDTPGPNEVVVGFSAPGLINPATGEPFIPADEPGEVDIFAAGFPADAVNITTLRFFNNTDFDITGFRLHIVGTADEPQPFNFTVTRDANVPAFFADLNQDGHVGVSDIFRSIDVSDDGRTITFSDGLIRPGDIFTDFIFSATSTGEPMKAAVEATFTGVPHESEVAPAVVPPGDYMM